MMRLRPAPWRRPPVGAGSLLALICAGALAQDGGLQGCRAIAEPAQRLVCYDALVAPDAPGAASAAAARSAGTAATATPLARFGLVRPDAAEPQDLRSSIPGRFEGWRPSTVFRLADGQAWRVSDDSSGVAALSDPAVTIRRAAMGSFLMEIDGVRMAVRVRRLD